MVKRKHAYIVAFFTSMILLLNACSGGGGGQEQATGNNSSPKPAEEKQWVIKIDPQNNLPRKATATDPREIKALTEIVAEYEKLKPNVKIEFVDVGNQDRSAWMQARMLSKDAPDVFWDNYDDTWLHYQKGWFLKMDDWLQKPNPYQDNKPWKDMFVPGILDSVRAPDGALYVIPADGVGVAIYYNKQIFNDLGLAIPKTWSEFMDAQAKIKAAGITPFAIEGKGDCCHLHWIDSIMSSQFYMGNISDMDRNGNNNLEVNEIALAVKDGKYPNQEQLTQQWKLVKDWSQYWNKGFTSATDSLQMFAQSKVAMIFGGSWTNGQLKQAKVPFEFGAFNFPVITPQDASLATGKQTKIYGAWGALQWLVPGYLAKEDPEKIPVIMDFLMFLSKPENVSKVDLESDGEPNIVGASPPPGHEVFHEDIDIANMQGYNSRLDKSYSSVFLAALQTYLTGSDSPEKFVDRVIEQSKKSSENLIKQNPDWTK